MYYYQIADVILKSEYRLFSFAAFECKESKFDIMLERTSEIAPPGIDRVAGSIVYRNLQDGWFFHSTETERVGIYINRDYTQLKALGITSGTIEGMEEWFVRIAIECQMVRRGFLSLHAAAVEVNGEAFAFSGPSGMGKSTRANAWIKELNAKMINGDRPLIDIQHNELYGVPWDGKEKCYRRVHYPLKAICEIRRSQTVYLRSMSFSQRRKLLLRQCFIPMWDTETSVIQMANIARLAAETEIVRAFCGPSENDARLLFSALQNHKQLKEENDIRIKQGFVLKRVMNGHILTPKSDNTGMLTGSILLNDIAAFVCRKLENPISKYDLLQAILDEFETEEAVALTDLEMLLTSFKEYGVLEDD